MKCVAHKNSKKLVQHCFPLLYSAYLLFTVSVVCMMVVFIKNRNPILISKPHECRKVVHITSAMMPISIPWKYICILLLLRIYSPEITSENYYYYATLLSQACCRGHENKAQCVVEQVRTLIALANDTYQFFLANPTEELRIKEAPSSDEKGKVNVSSAMSMMLNQLQKQYRNTLPGDVAKEVMRRLESIAFDHEKTDAFCTMKFGLGPLDTLNLINDVAQLTKMPRHLQNIVEKTIKVIDADSTIAQSTPFTSDGKAYYILTAAYRNGKYTYIQTCIHTEGCSPKIIDTKH